MKNGFHEMGMPNTIGCIDGMHVQIPKPRLHGQSYINRKKFASVILQVPNTPRVHCKFWQSSDNEMKQYAIKRA